MAEWLDLESLTTYLKMPKSTLYRLVQGKKLPGHKVGRSWRFDRDEIDRWIKSGSQSPMGAKK
jgi:excisionase family DNA binding protein